MENNEATIEIIRRDGPDTYILDYNFGSPDTSDIIVLDMSQKFDVLPICSKFCISRTFIESLIEAFNATNEILPVSTPKYLFQRSMFPVLRSSHNPPEETYEYHVRLVNEHDTWDADNREIYSLICPEWKYGSYWGEEHGGRLRIYRITV